jgi:RNA polymerase sigma factor (sigma-70 family)
MAAAPLRRLSAYLQRTSAVPPADADLLGRLIADRDAAAFTALVRRHGPAVLTACRQVLGDGPDADDVFQATFLVLWRDAGKVRRGASVGAWLYSVAHRLACRARAEAAWRRRREQLAAGGAPEAVPPPDVSWREACAVLHEELDRLPERFRLPLILCYLEGKSRDEAARALGWSVGALRGRLERGREHLRRRLVRRGIGLSAGLLAAIAPETSFAAVPEVLLRATEQLALQRATAAAVARLAGSAGRATMAWKTWTVAAVLLFAAAGTGVVTLRPDDQPAPEVPPTVNRPTLPVAPAAAAATGPLTINGQVVGPEGRPVAGARLSAPWDAAARRVPTGLVPAAADADGRFRCTLSAASAVRGLVLVAQADGYGAAWETVRPGPSEVTVTLRLPADDVPIRGRLLDLEGRPLAGVRVALHALQIPSGGDLTSYLDRLRTAPESSYHFGMRFLGHNDDTPLRPAVRTGADGRFELRGAGRDRLAVLRITGPGLALTDLTVVTRAGVNFAGLKPEVWSITRSRFVPPTFEYAVGPDQPVVGSVCAKGGAPVAGAKVVGSIFDRGVEVSAVTDAAGRYRLDGLGKGAAAVVEVRPPTGSGCLRAARAIAGAAGLGPATADFELPAGVVVHGWARDKADGRPVPGYVYYAPLPDNAHVKELPELPGRSDLHVLYSLRTDADGRFELTVPPGPGILLLEVEPDPRTGLPRYLLNRPPAKKDRPRSLEFLSSGDLVMVATAYGHMQFSTDCAYAVINPAPGAPPLDCVLECDPGVAQTAAVLDPDGRPLAGTIAHGLSPAWWFGEPTRLATAGFTAVALDPQQPRRVTVRHLERKLVGEVMLPTKDAQPPVVKLQPWGAVTGRCVDQDGRPVVGAQLRLHYQDEPNFQIALEEFHYLPVPVTADRDGRFRAEGLMPGRKVKVVSPLTAKPSAWTVRSGETHDLGTLTAAKVLPQPVP